MDEDDYKEYIDEEDARPRYFSNPEAPLASGNTQAFSCPECGSYNTAQGIYFEECRTCGWSQGY
jgi:hypothetical protein